MLTVRSYVPLLIQLLRLLTTVLSATPPAAAAADSVPTGNDDTAAARTKLAQLWLSAIKRQSEAFFAALTFTLAHCVNVELLKLTFDLANRLVNRGQPLQVLQDDGDDSNSNSVVEMVNFGALWLAAVDRDDEEEVEKEGNSERKQTPSSVISALNAACSTLLSYEAFSGGGGRSTSEDEEEDEDVQFLQVAATPANTTFLRHFWFIVSGLYSASSKFFTSFTTAHFTPASLRRLSKIFRRTGAMLLLLLGEQQPTGDFSSSLVAFAAPCTFFSRLVRSVQFKAERFAVEETTKKEKELGSEIRRLQHRLADSLRLAASLEKAKEMAEKAILEIGAKKSGESGEDEDEEDEEVKNLLKDALNWMKYFGVVVMGGPVQELGWLEPVKSKQLASSLSSWSSSAPPPELPNSSQQTSPQAVVI